MIIPIIYPSAGEFWLNSDPESLIGYSFNNRRLSDLPPDYEFCVSSQAAQDAARILGLSRPLWLTAPHANHKWRGPNCIIKSSTIPYPPGSFVHISRGGYDIYIASPELCFMQAARVLDLVDLVKFGYDLCALYRADPDSRYGQTGRTSFTSVQLIREYLKANHSRHGAAKGLKALKYVRDYSNSPMETRIAMFSVLPDRVGGCNMRELELNRAIDLTIAGKYLTGYSQIRSDFLFYHRLAAEYNSDSVHLDTEHYKADMNRQTALKLAGYDCIAITYGNIREYHSMIDIMNAILEILGMPELDGDDRRRRELYYRLFKE